MPPSLFNTGPSPQGLKPADSQPHVYNFDPAKLLNYRAARAKCLRGVRNCRIGFVGDSRAQSYGAASGGSGAVAAMDVQLARLFTAAGYTAGYQAAFGDHGIDWGASQTLPANWDNRIAATGFSVAGPFGFGGQYLFANSAGTYSFTPKDYAASAVSTDTCDIYYATYGGGGTFSKQIDSGTAANVSMDAGAAMAKTTLSGTAGNHTYKANFVSAGAGGVYVLGFDCYTAANKQFSFLNLGWTGSKAQWWADATQGWYPANNWSVLDLDLAIITLMANDVLYGDRTLAQAQVDLITVIGQAQAAGTDVIVLGYPPINPTSGFYNYTYTYAQQAQLDAAMKQAAMSADCPYISSFKCNGANFATINTLGLMFDDLHCNDVGYSTDASTLFQLLTAE